MPRTPLGRHRIDSLGAFGFSLGSNRALCAATIAARQNEFQLELEIHPRGRARRGGAQLRCSAWTTVSLPHSFNDVDLFRKFISHSGGDLGTFKGLVWYRKHFKLPAKLTGSKVFLEFEGMRQAGDIFLNGKAVGLYENGVTAYGLDISGAVHFGNEDNVLAVKVDNRISYVERSSNTPFEWNANDFNPDHGGINRHVWLYVTGKIYQTLPLYYGLESTGVYVHAATSTLREKCRCHGRIEGEERVGRSRHGGFVGRDCRSKRAGSRQIRRQLH